MQFGANTSAEQIYIYIYVCLQLESSYAVLIRLIRIDRISNHLDDQEKEEVVEVGKKNENI